MWTSLDLDVYGMKILLVQSFDSFFEVVAVWDVLVFVSIFFLCLGDLDLETRSDFSCLLEWFRDFSQVLGKTESFKLKITFFEFVFSGFLISTGRRIVEDFEILCDALGTTIESILDFVVI